MFWTILLVAWTLLHAYVFWRAASVPALASRLPRAALAAVAVTMWASIFLLRVGRRGGGVGAFLFELVEMHWLALLFLVGLALLAVDLLTGFGLWLRALAPRLRGLALVAGLLLATAAVVQGLRPPVVSDYEVRLAGLPPTLDGTVVVALSDLHLGELIGADWMSARADQVKALDPDLVVFLGDLFEGHGAPDPGAVKALSAISAPLGVWRVTGNHESHGTGTAEATSADTGIRVLHDGWAELAPGLVLAGVNDRSFRRAGPHGDVLSRTLEGRPVGATILLSHRPWQAEVAARAGVGLMLSGHTHAGQIWPFGLLVRTQYPLLSGRYEVGGMTAIVCRGTGTWGPRMRLWRPGEILRITLRA